MHILYNMVNDKKKNDLYFIIVARQINSYLTKNFILLLLFEVLT